MASRSPLRRASAQAFDECSPGLRRYAVPSADSEVTEDVVQEVFLQLFRHLRWAGRANLHGWIFRRPQPALKQREGGETSPMEAGRHAVDRVTDPAANPEQQLVDDRRTRRLRAVVLALPERDRQCLFLRAEGLRYREIAKILDVSLGAVAKSLTRTMTRLTNVDEG